METKKKKTTTPAKAHSSQEEEFWTPENKAEFRKKMPKKLNKFGEWFFSEAGGKEYLIVVDRKAVMK